MGLYPYSSTRDSTGRSHFNLSAGHNLEASKLQCGPPMHLLKEVGECGKRQEQWYLGRETRTFGDEKRHCVVSFYVSFLLPFFMKPVFQPGAKLKLVSSSHKNHFKITNTSSSFHPQLQQTGLTAPNRNEIADWFSAPSTQHWAGQLRPSTKRNVLQIILNNKKQTSFTPHTKNQTLWANTKYQTHLKLIVLDQIPGRVHCVRSTKQNVK